MEWWHLVLIYLLIGFCTQLPGDILYRRYLPPRLIREGYERHGARIFLETPIVWIPFTILFWPIPFLRVGLNYIAVELLAVGILSAYIVIKLASTLWADALTIIIAGAISVFLARPGKKWPTII
jgi:hypothetical protein